MAAETVDSMRVTQWTRNGTMNEILRKELWRKLESLPDEKAYQVLDYIKFLEVRYGETGDRASGFQRFAEGVQDTMRRGRVPGSALRETMKAFSAADRVLGAFKDAGKEFLAEMEKGAPEPSAPKKGDEKKEPPDSREIEVD